MYALVMVVVKSLKFFFSKLVLLMLLVDTEAIALIERIMLLVTTRKGKRNYALVVQNSHDHDVGLCLMTVISFGTFARVHFLTEF